MKELGNKKLEQAIERALDKSDGEGDAVLIDAAAVAKVVSRWHGDDAVRVLEKSLEFARASV